MNAHKSGRCITKEEDAAQAIMVKQVKTIGSMLSLLKKHGRIENHINNDFDRQLLEAIKAKRSSISPIVRNMNETNK